MARMKTTLSAFRKWKGKGASLTYLLLVQAIVISTSVIAVVAQHATPQSGERGAKSDAFRISAAVVLGNRQSGKVVPNRHYRLNRPFPRSNPSVGRKFVTLGITLSRARPPTETELSNAAVAKVKGCIQWLEKKCVGRHEMVLARMTDDTAVSDRDQIQMNIEYLAYLDLAGKKRLENIGYLYVVNREQYPNGKYSKARLIFPTLNTYEGDNRVLPGRTVAMPEPERPWTISRSESRTAQAFETYTVIVSPRPLRDLSGGELQLDTSPLILEEELMASWVPAEDATNLRGDLEDGNGQLITERELKSGGPVGSKRRGTFDDNDDLKKSDPPPQIIFSKLIKPGGKMVVTIRLPYDEKSQ